MLFLRQMGQGFGRLSAAIAMAKSGVKMTALCPEGRTADIWRALNLPNVTLIVSGEDRGQPIGSVICDELEPAKPGEEGK